MQRVELFPMLTSQFMRSASHDSCALNRRASQCGGRCEPAGRGHCRVADRFVPAGHRQLRGENQRADLISVFADLPEVTALWLRQRRHGPNRRSQERQLGSIAREDCGNFHRHAPRPDRGTAPPPVYRMPNIHPDTLSVPERRRRNFSRRRSARARKGSRGSRPTANPSPVRDELPFTM
jgi:hypothetical protein